MDRQGQKPIVTLIALKILLLVAFLAVTHSSRTNITQTVTIGNPPFTECERPDVIAAYQKPAWLSRNLL